MNSKRRTLLASITRSSIAKAIIRLLAAGFYQAQIAKSNVNYWVNKLESANLIRRKQSLTPSIEGTQHIKTRGVIILYEATVNGTKLLDGFEQGGGVWPRVRLHNVVFRYPIIQAPLVPVDWSRVEMRNWTQYKTKVDELRAHLRGKMALWLQEMKKRGIIVSNPEAVRFALPLLHNYYAKTGNSSIQKRACTGQDEVLRF